MQSDMRDSATGDAWSCAETRLVNVQCRPNTNSHVQCMAWFLEAWATLGSDAIRATVLNLALACCNQLHACLP